MTEDQLTEIRTELRSGLDMSEPLPDEALLAYIERRMLRHNGLRNCTAAEKRRLIRRMFDSFRGLDVLQPLVDDRSISEIMINRYDEIFVERSGRMERVPVKFSSEERLEDIIQTIVSAVNRVVNEASPVVDARLKDGSRVNIALPPVALKGPAVTIRKFPERPLMIADLIDMGSLTAEAAGLLEVLIKSKYNIFISGGTGTGKTTFLNALSQFIPASERIITIEDSAELQILTVPNLVSLETRNANTEGRGAISIRDLIRASLRMRPNRIVVGEVRGAEAADMLQAMNTGHDGSLSTGHANSTVDMISRLETMVLSGANLPIEVIRRQISSAIDIFVHLSRMRDGSRKVTEISEVAGMLGGEIELNPLFEYRLATEEHGAGAGMLSRTNRELIHKSKLELAGLVLKGGSGEA